MGRQVLIDDVAAGAARDAGGVDPLLLRNFLPLVVDAVAAGRQLGRREVLTFRDAGAQAARDGVALRALLDLYLSAAWRIWRQLPQVEQAVKDPEGVVRAGEVLLHAADDAVAALAEGYQLARRDLVRAEEAARREFIDDLLGGGAVDVGGLVERAIGFGLDLTAPHAVAVVRAEQPFSDGPALPGLVARAVAGSKGDTEALVATKEGRLVVVFAAPNRAAVGEVVQRLTRVLPARPGARPGVELQRQVRVGPWQLGVGRPQPGPTGVRLSFDEACDALDLGHQLGRSEAVLDAADLLVYRLLLRDEVALRDLVTDLLGPLVQARGGATPLLDTLAAYFAAGGNSAQTARAMQLSVRAVSYRLERVRVLTGQDPDDPGQRFALHTAVIGARLLGWPAAG